MTNLSGKEEFRCNNCETLFLLPPDTIFYHCAFCDSELKFDNAEHIETPNLAQPSEPENTTHLELTNEPDPESGEKDN